MLSRRRNCAAPFPNRFFSNSATSISFIGPPCNFRLGTDDGFAATGDPLAQRPEGMVSVAKASPEFILRWAALDGPPYIERVAKGWKESRGLAGFSLEFAVLVANELAPFAQCARYDVATVLQVADDAQAAPPHQGATGLTPAEFGGHTRCSLKREVIELKQVGNLWVVMHNATALVYAAHRDAAIDVAAGALLEVTANPEGLELHGLSLSELLPAKAADPKPARSPSKIDFAEAKRLAVEDSFEYYEGDMGTAIAVVDELCDEYEWGWVIKWRPVDPEKRTARAMNIPYFPITVDRVTGKVGSSGGTYGIERGIVELLQHRPPELRGPYPPGRQRWLTVLDEFKKAGAFTPLVPRPDSDDEIASN